MPETAAVHETTSESVNKVLRGARAFADAVDNTLDMAKQVGKHGSDAAEQLMDDTVERIKRHPTETVVMAFALGFFVGGFVSWLTRR